MQRFERILDGTEWALRRLQIGLYFVEEDGRAELVLEHEDRRED